MAYNPYTTIFTSENGYSTFSGADIVCSITVPMLTTDPVNGNAVVSSAPVIIGNLQTISVSTHRDVQPVGALGFVNAKGYTKGRRTIAGSLIFTLFNHESLQQVQKQVRDYYQRAKLIYDAAYGNNGIKNLIPHFKVDELPPFDVTITGANELGQAIQARVIGIQIVDNGVVMGIDDLFTEETMSYIAQDYNPPAPYDPLHPHSRASSRQ